LPAVSTHLRHASRISSEPSTGQNITPACSSRTGVERDLDRGHDAEASQPGSPEETTSPSIVERSDSMFDSLVFDPDCAAPKIRA
jgi:hypothetical protein